MKTIVVSAVNLRKGGTLTILQDCLQALSQMVKQGDFRVVALVHRKKLAEYDGIEYIELPWSARSWMHRLWCEYVTIHGISKHLGNIDLWLSLHDTTPRVRARQQAVYCHNAYPFFRWQWHHVWLNYRIVCFTLFTKLFYRINLHRNTSVIVQSQWFREAFAQMTGFDTNRIIVFPPASAHPLEREINVEERPRSAPFSFLYPAYPDVHKNVECLCAATEMLEREVGATRFQVHLTTTPTANRYTRWLHRKWGHLQSIRFCGFLSKEKLNELYANTDCLVFPSQVETWGLPISEFAYTGRPMLLADRPYTRETASGSHQTAFFNPDKPETLKNLMQQVLNCNHSVLQHIAPLPIQQPVVHTWQEIIDLLSS